MVKDGSGGTGYKKKAGVSSPSIAPLIFSEGDGANWFSLRLGGDASLGVLVDAIGTYRIISASRNLKIFLIWN